MVKQVLEWGREVVLQIVHLVEIFSARLEPSDWLTLGVLTVASQLCARLGMWAYCLATLPGTLAHELSHYLVALVLGARPSLPSIIPKRIKSGWRLGSVQFSAGLLRTVPIALAPLALAPLSLWWATDHLPGRPFGLAYLCHAWVAATAFSASLPSSQDWSIAAPTLFLAVLIVAACLL